MTARIPIVDYLVIDDGDPYLVAHEAEDSGALSFTRRNADPVNGTPGFIPRRLETTGTVRAFTVVHRDAPGIEVPYASVIVALDGGGVVRGRLTGTSRHPRNVATIKRVRLTTFVAGVDDHGTEAIAYAFEPEPTGDGDD
ncbi:MAG: hypothetical protein EXQ79_04690 [Acidimicrobiia bacterium]|nr:hypothetical protein [Acidimicrobiia bacterium]